MENKINIAELLKDCPEGMELDCTMFENVTFVKVDNNKKFPIEIAIGGLRSKCLTKEGCFHDLWAEAKCVIFPKGKTTWEGFVPPCKFKDGDIIVTTLGNIAIISGHIKKELFYIHALLIGDNFFNDENNQVFVKRLATEEEKQKLFDAIKTNGYRWNAETKTLEELITPNKFDITTLKPFDKVLVRDNNEQKWTVDMFSFYDKNLIYPFVCVVHHTKQCITYKQNKHLLGTTDNCDEYYKTWE